MTDCKEPSVWIVMIPGPISKEAADESAREIFNRSLIAVCASKKDAYKYAPLFNFEIDIFELKCMGPFLKTIHPVPLSEKMERDE